MDRYLPGSGPSPDPAEPAVDVASVASGLALIALAPVSVALLRLFPPLLPDGRGLEWLLPLVGGIAATLIGAAMLPLLERGLRRGSLPDLLRAAALGVLATGLAVASLRAVSAPDRSTFPDGGLAVTGLAAAALLLVGQLAPAASPARVDRAPIAWLLLFVAIEAGLAAALLLPPATGAWPWLLGLAAALAAASAVPGPWLAAGLVATGMAALGASRLGSLDTLPGLLAVASGALAYARARSQEDVAAQLRAADEELAAPVAPAAASDEEARRLARELRGTIEELLHARRTIELQREEIAQSAAVDSPTGVGTRRAILERLRIEAAEARRYQHPVAVVLLDVDGFAALNHERGMRVGDEVLREVALRLRLRIRAADALGRVGGDSFLALLPHTDETGAATFADALRRRLVSRPIETSEGEVSIGVSIGVAFMRPGMSLTDEELLAAADEALASARAAGGNRIAFDRLHGLARIDARRAAAGKSSA